VIDADSFHPEFYATMATVLPLLLVVTNLQGWFVQQPRTHETDSGLAGWLTRSASRTSAMRLWSAVVAVLLNVVAEIAAVIALFNRADDKTLNVLIWVGFTFSMFAVWFVVTARLAVRSKTSKNATTEPTNEVDPTSG
jgi:hypothetical protein